jgi:hypothetical protein
LLENVSSTYYDNLGEHLSELNHEDRNVIKTVDGSVERITIWLYMVTADAVQMRVGRILCARSVSWNNWE